jgi:hypothetical protein
MKTYKVFGIQKQIVELEEIEAADAIDADLIALSNNYNDGFLLSQKDKTTMKDVFVVEVVKQ